MHEFFHLFKQKQVNLKTLLIHYIFPYGQIFNILLNKEQAH